MKSNHSDEFTGIGVDPVSWKNFVSWLDSEAEEYEKTTGEKYRPVIPHEQIMRFWLDHTGRDPSAARAFRDVWHDHSPLVSTPRVRADDER